MAKNAAAAASSSVSTRATVPAGADRRGAHPLPTRRLGLVLLIAVVAAVALLPTTLLAAVLLMPTLVAAIVDRDREKFAPITVGTLNAAGASPAVAELWSRGAGLDSALSVLGDPFLWLFALAASGIGWGLHMLVPPVTSAVLAWKLERRRTLLEEGRETLAQEWGEAVAAAEAETGLGEAAAGRTR